MANDVDSTRQQPRSKRPSRELRHCGDCGDLLEFEQRSENRLMARCCGRTYEKTVFHVGSKPRQVDATGALMTPNSDYSFQRRNAIDAEYKGTWDANDS